MRHLNGLLRPTEGRVLLDGEDVARSPGRGARRDRSASSFQNPDRQIFAGRSGREVAFGPRNLGRSAAETCDAAVDRGARRRSGLADEADANPYDLGYSRRKLLALASVLAMGTPVVVLDEPTTGQDARGVARVAGGRRGARGGRPHGRSRSATTCGSWPRRSSGSSSCGPARVVLDGPPTTVFAAAAWPMLASTYLEPPLAARVGARLGLGSTPTEARLIQALREAAPRA